jgi:hypothetical protein
MNPQYSSNCCRERTLTILPIPIDAITIANPADFTNDFKDDARKPEEVIQDSCYHEMLREMLRSVREIRKDTTVLNPTLFSSLHDARCFKEVTHPVGKDNTEYEFLLPKNECIGKEVDIALIFNKITFDRRKKAGSSGAWVPVAGGGRMMVGGSGGSDKLESKLLFIIWDYKANAPVCYGETSVANSVFMAMTRNTWKQQYSQILRGALQKTPFKIELSQ